MSEEQEPRLPPWNWRELSEQERRVELEDLAEWVADLQEAFGRWVRLPPCWPRHGALREELAIFWYWRQRLYEASDVGPEEAVRWYQSLRAAGQIWAEAYGGCRHESLGEVDEQRDSRDARLAETRPHLEEVAGIRQLASERVEDEAGERGSTVSRSSSDRP